MSTVERHSADVLSTVGDKSRPDARKPADDVTRSRTAWPGAGSALGNRATEALLQGKLDGIVTSVERGSSLDDTTRARMESVFGDDFSDVRVHTDNQDAGSAAALGAKAYTVSEDVVFGPGRYAPQTHEGLRLLAHELSHVVQQRRGAGSSASLSGAEAEARIAGDRAVAGQAVTVQSVGSGAAQLDPADDDDRILRAFQAEQRKKEDPPMGSPEWVRRFQGRPESAPPTPAGDELAHKSHSAPKISSPAFAKEQIAQLRLWAETPAVDPPKPATPNATSALQEPSKLSTLLQVVAQIGLTELKIQISRMVPPRFFEFGHARRGFVAGITGVPLTPPTDEFDKTQWEKGQNMAGVVVAAEAIAGGLAPPSSGSGMRGLAPAGGGRMPMEAPPVPRLQGMAPVLEARTPQPQNATKVDQSKTPVAALGSSPSRQSDDERRAQIARKPSSEAAPATPGETPKQAQERTDAAREEFKKSGGNVEKIVGETQKHHVVSNKAPTSAAAKESIDILDGARTSKEQPDLLTSEENVISIENHGDKHGENYHVIIRNRLRVAVSGKTPNTPEYREAVIDTLQKLKIEIRTKGTPLNLMTIKISKGGTR